MDINRSAGLLSIILGLIFIIFPMFSSELVSIIVGLSLLFFGISAAFMGYQMKNQMSTFSKATIIIGAIAVIFGFIFIFYIDALSFIIGLQFYIVGFIMIVFGINGLLSNMTRFSTFTSVLVMLMGMITIAVSIFAVKEPIYLAIIIGSVLIIEGIGLILD